MNTPHVHSELIKAWADGAEIEILVGKNWEKADSILWSWQCEYRVKPTPKPNVVTWHCVYSSSQEVTRGLPIKPFDTSPHVAVLRIEIDHNDPANPKLVSATLEKP